MPTTVIWLKRGDGRRAPGYEEVLDDHLAALWVKRGLVKIKPEKAAPKAKPASKPKATALPGPPKDRAMKSPFDGIRRRGGVQAK